VKSRLTRSGMRAHAVAISEDDTARAWAGRAQAHSTASGKQDEAQAPLPVTSDPGKPSRARSAWIADRRCRLECRRTW